eukprot:6483394-Amphidinium_carterae.3
MGKEGAGIAKLKAKITEECIPSEQKEISLDTALKGIRKTMSTNLYKFLEASAKNQLESVQDWVQALATNKQPKVLSQASPWLTECWSGMPWFFKTSYKHPASEEGGEEKVVTLRGGKAIQKAWEFVKDKPTNELVVMEIDALLVFAAWLPSGASMSLSKKKMALVKEKASTEPKQKDEDKKKRGKPSGDEKALEAAKAFLSKKAKRAA